MTLLVLVRPLLRMPCACRARALTPLCCPRARNAITPTAGAARRARVRRGGVGAGAAGHAAGAPREHHPRGGGTSDGTAVCFSARRARAGGGRGGAGAHRHGRGRRGVPEQRGPCGGGRDNCAEGSDAQPPQKRGAAGAGGQRAAAHGLALRRRGHRNPAGGRHQGHRRRHQDAPGARASRLHRDASSCCGALADRPACPCRSNCAIWPPTWRSCCRPTHKPGAAHASSLCKTHVPIHSHSRACCHPRSGPQQCAAAAASSSGRGQGCIVVPMLARARNNCPHSLDAPLLLYTQHIARPCTCHAASPRQRQRPLWRTRTRCFLRSSTTPWRTRAPLLGRLASAPSRVRCAACSRVRSR